MKIDVRSENSLYVEMDGYMFYIDNSTNEQIMDCWKKDQEDNDQSHYEFTRFRTDIKRSVKVMIPKE